MCGIFGYHSSLVLPAETQAKIVRSIGHRGPDDSGVYANEGLFFAHTRLSIVDLSYNGHQPMHDATGNYTIVFNGEIYNHLDIRQNLLAKGYTFQSTSDTETLLYGYIEYGPAIVSRLNGIFAFGVFDKRKQAVFVARDHFGTKPLYYYHRGGQFAFGSEIKSFLQVPGIDKQLNYAAFPYYMQMLYAPGEITPFEHIKKLKPGNCMTYQLQGGNLEIAEYYPLQYTGAPAKITEAEWIDLVDEGLNLAVQRQLMSDVPLGSFLSGGLDSSLITALAQKNYDGRIQAFTISSNQQFYEEGFDEDEKYASKIAKDLNVDLHHIQANFQIVDDFDKMIWHLDEPQADPAPLLVYRISSAAKNMGIKVLLSGTAGDDIFSGYRRHQALNYEKYLQFITPGMANGFTGLLNKWGSEKPLSRRLKKILAVAGKSPYERWASYFSWLPQNQVLSLFDRNISADFLQQELPESHLIGLLQSLPAETKSLNKMLFLEMKTFLPDHNLNYTDKMSMATGVEVRVPFLDQDLVNLVASMPVKYKMKGTDSKYILKKVAERYLPKELIYRKKTGFGAPVRTWIKHEMKDMIAERLSKSSIQDMGFLDVDAVLKLIADNEKGKIDASYSIWSLLSIQSWLKQFSAPAENASQSQPVLQNESTEK